MNDKLSESDRALWLSTMGIEAEKDRQEKVEDFAALLDHHDGKQKPEPTTKPENKQSVPEEAKAKKQIRPNDEPLDKSLERKLRQGRIEPQKIIDLHGLNQQQAFAHLSQTLNTAHVADRRVILVITGKGKGAAQAQDWLTPGQGILKQKLPQWVRSGTLKNIVIDAVPCHPKHGGSGAYYVLLKKRK